MSYAIIRGANGRRHEVDFDGVEIKVEVYSNDTTIEIVVEAQNGTAPFGRNRFATLSLPRDLFSAALGQAAQRPMAAKTRQVS